jgi:hypothetical protein
VVCIQETSYGHWYGDGRGGRSSRRGDEWDRHRTVCGSGSWCLWRMGSLDEMVIDVNVVMYKFE